MSIADKIPGMKSGSIVRNLIVLFLYFFLLPLIVILLPIIMGILVARNYGGWADALSRLPGVSRAGGWKSGLSAAAYMFGILLLVGAVTDGSDANSTDSALEDDSSDTSADGATSSNSDDAEDTTAEPADSSPQDDGTESGADTDDPPESSDSDETDGSETEAGTDETTSNEESTTDSTASELETEDEPESSRADSSSTEATDDEPATSEPSSEATETTETETTDDSETRSTVSVPAEVSDGEARQATVTRVIDGDTMEVQFANGEEDTVRLIGVDTPETTLGNVNPSEYEDVPDTQAGRDHLYGWGQEASQYATDELEGREVRVVTDPEGDRRGSYGRLLAYIYVGDENFNRTLLEGGYARVYESSFSLRDEFDSTEAAARSNDVGLWDFEDDSSPSETDESESEDESSSSDTDESESDSGDEIDIPPVPADGDYDCSHFETQEQAQYVLEDTAGDPHRLDADDDGIACETLS